MEGVQVDIFWRQLYFFAYANHGFPVPARPKISLADMRRMLDEELADAEEEAEEPWYIANDGREFLPQDFIALQYFERQVEKYSQYVGITTLVRRLLESWTNEDGEVEASRQGQIHVAACNCPYCWEYMEGLPPFAAHLWTKHAVIERNDHSPDPVQGEQQESSEQEAEHEAKLQRDVEEQERKDSGYSDTMTMEETTARNAEVAELETPPAARGSIDPRLLSSSMISNKAGLPPPAALQSTKNMTLWKNLIQPPMAIGKRSMFTGGNLATNKTIGTGRQALLNQLQEVEKRAQKVRDEMSRPSWYNPYQDWVPITSTTTMPPPRPGKPINALVSYKNFSLFSSPERRTKDETTPPLEAPSVASSLLTPPAKETRYWICAHDPDCQMRFENVVNYLEHLADRGFVVFKKYRELHPPMVLNSKNLRASAKGI